MIEAKVAVGVGYEFSIVSGNLVKDVCLEWSGEVVNIGGETYPLYKGLEYEDSRKIDAIMDGPTHPNTYKIAEHIVNN